MPPARVLAPVTASRIDICGCLLIPVVLVALEIIGPCLPTRLTLTGHVITSDSGLSEIKVLKTLNLPMLVTTDSLWANLHQTGFDLSLDDECPASQHHAPG